MSMDQRLSHAARRFAEGVVPPEVDLDAVRSQARVNRRLQVSLIAAAAVVAVVAASAAVAGVGRDRSGPAPVDPVPSPRLSAGAPVWYDAAGLHHGDVVQQTPVELNGPNPVGGRMGVLALVRDGALYRDPATDDVWFHPWDAEPRVVGHDSQTGPGGDPEGDVAAWFEGEELVVYDTARGREISRTEEAPVLLYASTEHVNDGSGFLHVSSEEVVWRSEYTLGLEYLVGRLDVTTGAFSTLWEAHLDTGGGVDPEFDANPQLTDVRDATRVWGDFENPPALTVEVAGNEPLPLPDVEPTGKLSADGSFLLTPVEVDDSHGAAIVDVDTGEAWHLGGSDEFYAWISWAYGDVAVVQVDPGGRGNGPVIACHAVIRECSVLKTRGDVVLPTS